MPGPPTTSGWPFPPSTREIQFDEKWAFVHKKQAHCDPDCPADDELGDCWDHVALDAESRLVLAVIPGKRTAENTHALVAEAHRRTDGRTDVLLTSDAYAPYRDAILEVYGRPGRGPAAGLVLPKRLCYATVQKRRQGGRVVEVIRALVFGTLALLTLWLVRSRVSRTVNTAFVERHNGTDRRRNGRKQRKTYGFSKNLGVHEAVTYFVTYSDNFCWPVRTLRERNADGKPGPPRTPAMAAKLTDHVWSLREWVTLPAVERCGRHSNQASSPEQY